MSNPHPLHFQRPIGRTLSTVRSALARCAVLSLLLSLLLPAAVNAQVSRSIERVSVHSDGSPANHWSYDASLSADGRFVAFQSLASNLVDNDNNGTYDIFVHDRQLGTTTRVSVGIGGVESNGASSYPRISNNGRYILFDSGASNLVANDTNGKSDVFLYDRETQTINRVSIGSAGVQGNDDSHSGSISDDGRYVTFQSDASNLVANDTNGFTDVFVHDRSTGTTRRISVSSTGVQSNNHALGPRISADGRFVAFDSWADNLVTDDSNNSRDAFIHDLSTGVTSRVSVSSSGVQGNSESYAARVSGDGRFIAFESHARNLVANDTSIRSDIFVHDRNDGSTTRVSVSSTGEEATHSVSHPNISTDGRYVTFYSAASNLSTPASNGTTEHVYVHDRNAGSTMRVSVNASDELGNRSSYGPILSADGRYIAFESMATNLIADDSNNAADIFIVRNPLTPAQVDLSLTQSLIGSTVVAGTSVSYNITVSNNGPDNATAATVNATLPLSLSNINWTCVGNSGGTCADTGSGGFMDTVNLPAGASVVYTLTATLAPAASGTLSTIATVTAPAGVTDVDLNNNSATDSSAIEVRGNLTVTLNGPTTPVTAGSTVSYTLIASNVDGPSTAAGVVVNTQLSTLLNAISWTCVAHNGASCTASGSGDLADIINLPPGSSVVYTLTALLPTNATGSLDSSASLSAPSGFIDPDSSDDRTQLSATIVAAATPAVPVPLFSPAALAALGLLLVAAVAFQHRRRYLST